MSAIIEESDGGTKKKLEKALKKLQKRLNKGEEIKTELDKIWEKIKQEAYTRCPKDTGMLASTIRTMKTPMGSAAGAFSKVKEYTIFDRSIIAGNILKTNPKSGKPVDYAMWVHDGHRMKDGRMYEGVPFLSEAVAQYEEELMKAIYKALEKLGKKYESE